MYDYVELVGWRLEGLSKNTTDVVVLPNNAYLAVQTKMKFGNKTLENFEKNSRQSTYFEKKELFCFSRFTTINKIKFKRFTVL